MRFMFLLMLAAALSMAGPAMAQEYRLDDLIITHPFATPSPPSVDHAAVYVDISIASGESDALVGASTPASETVELHDMAMEGGVMRMFPVDEIEVPTSTLLTMRPGGGHHLMLSDLTAPLREGDSFPLTLTFAERGEVDIHVRVQSAGDGGADAGELLHRHRH
ncbi:copper chaperone PCu(A)C [Billgrantia montanilacus]|uniref:Copper chaperone PCu(A)C n=1 Tax=Billgrantia montanilacus TaxID=2282305 RepID=A0A368U6B3_9GAMM|nr:copper chaperone PCu(A)C [Halomonas montanilacus]RCV90573.1 copper chaperone PCu(A)C [Halomonas montanilacus]